MPDWRIASIRFTVFVTPDAVVSSALWRDLLGEDPETSSMQRTAGILTEMGPFADGNLRLQIQPVRVDWAYEALQHGVIGSRTPVLGQFPTSSTPFLDLMRRWITSPSFPTANRIAIGATLLSPTADRYSGYEELRAFIDGVPQAADATDFLYQVNRPRPSRVLEGLQINRLSRWSVAAFMQLSLTLGQTWQHVPQQQPQYFLQLELDVNTSGDFQGILPGERVDPLLSDLMDGAQEIIEQGNRF